MAKKGTSRKSRRTPTLDLLVSGFVRFSYEKTVIAGRQRLYRDLTKNTVITSTVPALWTHRDAAEHIARKTQPVIPIDPLSVKLSERRAGHPEIEVARDCEVAGERWILEVP